MPKKTYMNWSGGKDSSLCLFRALQSGQFQIEYLLTSVNREYDRVSMHGIRRSLLIAQSESIGIPLKILELPVQPDMAEYEMEMARAISEIQSEGIDHTLFGDIFLEDLRKYRESKLIPLGIQCSFPLWQNSTKELLREFVDLGFKAILVCVDSRYLDQSFCGRLIDETLIADLPDPVDPCGENGEYHTFVYDGPIFKSPIPFVKGDVVYREYQQDQGGEPQSFGFYFCDLLPKNSLEAI